MTFGLNDRPQPMAKVNNALNGTNDTQQRQNDCRYRKKQHFVFTRCVSQESVPVKGDNSTQEIGDECDVADLERLLVNQMSSYGIMIVRYLRLFQSLPTSTPSGRTKCRESWRRIQPGSRPWSVNTPAPRSGRR
jgi:hypothetical protein